MVRSQLTCHDGRGCDGSHRALYRGGGLPLVQFAREPIGPGRVRGEGLHIFDCHGQAIAFSSGPLRHCGPLHCVRLPNMRRWGARSGISRPRPPARFVWPSRQRSWSRVSMCTREWTEALSAQASPWCGIWENYAQGASIHSRVDMDTRARRLDRHVFHRRALSPCSDASRVFAFPAYTGGRRGSGSAAPVSPR